MVSMHFYTSHLYGFLCTNQQKSALNLLSAGHLRLWMMQRDAGRSKGTSFSIVPISHEEQQSRIAASHTLSNVTYLYNLPRKSSFHSLDCHLLFHHGTQGKEWIFCIVILFCVSIGLVLLWLLEKIPNSPVRIWDILIESIFLSVQEIICIKGTANSQQFSILF